MIQRGLGYAGRQFGLFIEQKFHTLRAFSSALENEFQYYFLDQVEQANASTNSDEFKKALAIKTKNWMLGLKDLVPYNQELTDYAVHLVSNALAMQTTSEPARLKRYFEDFILNEVKIYTQSVNQDEKDLGILMHMVIWDYMTNIELSQKRRTTL